MIVLVLITLTKKLPPSSSNKKKAWSVCWRDAMLPYLPCTLSSPALGKVALRAKRRGGGHVIYPLRVQIFFISIKH